MSYDKTTKKHKQATGERWCLDNCRMGAQTLPLIPTAGGSTQQAMQA